jgi:general stress protein CsbA
VFGTDMSIRKVFFVVLFTKVMSGRLEGIVLSVIMLRSQYSLKFSFSSTLAGVCIIIIVVINLHTGYLQLHRPTRYEPCF